MPACRSQSDGMLVRLAMWNDERRVRREVDGVAGSGFVESLMAGRLYEVVDECRLLRRGGGRSDGGGRGRGGGEPV